MIEATPEGKLLNLIRKSQHKSKLKKDLKIFTKVNVILIAVIAVIFAIFLLDVFIFKNKNSEIPQNVLIKENEVQPVKEDIQEDADIVKEQPKNIIPIHDIKANLNLLGIVTGDNNQAIIEDKNLKKTFFLYKGDNIGELKVYDIKNNAVILDYKGEKIELNI
jgi:cell division protein FtsL